MELKELKQHFQLYGNLWLERGEQSSNTCSLSYRSRIKVYRKVLLHIVGLKKIKKGEFINVSFLSGAIKNSLHVSLWEILELSLQRAEMEEM